MTYNTYDNILLHAVRKDDLSVFSSDGPLQVAHNIKYEML